MKPRENVQPLRLAEEIQQFRQALQMSRTAERDLLMFDMEINTGLRISDLLPLNARENIGHHSRKENRQETNGLFTYDHAGNCDVYGRKRGRSVFIRFTTDRTADFNDTGLSNLSEDS